MAARGSRADADASMRSPLRRPSRSPSRSPRRSPRWPSPCTERATRSPPRRPDELVQLRLMSEQLILRVAEREADLEIMAEEHALQMRHRRDCPDDATEPRRATAPPRGRLQRWAAHGLGAVAVFMAVGLS